MFCLKVWTHCLPCRTHYTIFRKNSHLKQSYRRWHETYCLRLQAPPTLEFLDLFLLSVRVGVRLSFLVGVLALTSSSSAWVSAVCWPSRSGKAFVGVRLFDLEEATDLADLGVVTLALSSDLELWRELGRLQK